MNKDRELDRGFKIQTAVHSYPEPEAEPSAMIFLVEFNKCNVVDLYFNNKYFDPVPVSTISTNLNINCNVTVENTIASITAIEKRHPRASQEDPDNESAVFWYSQEVTKNGFRCKFTWYSK